MVRRKPFPVKKAIFCFMAAVFVAGVSFIILLAGISIRIGLGNMNQDGFFIPALAGIFSIAVCLFIFYRVLKLVFSTMRKKDLFTSR
jgi:hypothetical protein